MCVLLLIVLVPAAILFGLPFLGVFFGLNSIATAVDKKKHGDGEPDNNEERMKRVATRTAFWCIVMLLFFIAFLVLRYYMT